MSDPITRLRTALADRYEIEHELGQGGMATVYLAHDIRHDRRVALKVLRPELSAILGAERFLAEIKTTANLQHPHILSLFDSGTAEGTVFYVMPYVEGESLRGRLMREKQLPVEEAIRIAREIADALDYAHRHGVIHRDIEPENILLHDGRALVADFGIALAVSRSEGGTRMTETGMSLGTPHYMSPEQAMGEREITPKADIYALGCVLYEMLTAEPPFTGATAQAIIARVMTEEPRSLTLQRRTIPPHVEGAILTSLAKLPADRFASAAEFAEALANPAYASALSRTVPSLVPRAIGARWLSSWAPWALTAAALVLAAAGWLGRRTGAAPERVVGRFYHLPDSLHEVVSLAVGAPVAISPDGRVVAYEGASAAGVYVYIRELDQLVARQLPDTRGARGLAFSPDGQWVAYAFGGSIRKVPVAGGAPVTVGEFTGVIAGLSWTGANTIVAAPLDSGGLFAVPAEGGGIRRLTRVDTASGERGHMWPHWIRGTDRLLFTSWGGGGWAQARIGLIREGRPEVRYVSAGSLPWVTASGQLVTVRSGGVVVAQRFNPRTGDTTGPTQRLADGVITRAGGLGEYAVSWTGTMVIRQEQAGAAHLSLVGTEGREQRLPITLPQVSHFDNPRVSPDGRRLAVAGFHDQESRHVGYILDPARGTSLRLTFGANTEYLEWTPDGQSMVFSHDYVTIAVRRADGGGQERTLVAAPGGRVLGRLSVGREWVVFGVQSAGHGDIKYARLDRSDSVRIYLATPFDEVGPSLSPDGRWLAYVTNETGRDEVYVSTFPESGPRTSISTDGGSEPQWSRDGRTLYYRSGIGELVAVRVRPSPAGLEVERRTTLFRAGFEPNRPGAEYDVFPGGSRFVVVGTGGSRSRLIIATNAVP